MGGPGIDASSPYFRDVQKSCSGSRSIKLGERQFCLRRTAFRITIFHGPTSRIYEDFVRQAWGPNAEYSTAVTPACCLSGRKSPNIFGGYSAGYNTGVRTSANGPTAAPEEQQVLLCPAQR